MARYDDLIIGDIHSQVSNLSDTEKLLRLIKEKTLELNVKRVIFLGDLFHTHGIVRQEVAHLYREFISNMTTFSFNHETPVVYIIAGNHDGVSPSNTEKNACEMVFGDMGHVRVISSLYWDMDYTMMAFKHDNSEFVQLANSVENPSDKILLCHQSFDGACYESGMPIPNGVKAKDVNYPLVVAGHIHKSQMISDKVFYVGTPRMVTASEANESKYIYHVHGDSPATVTFDKICTDHLVKRYFTASFKEGGPTKVDLASMNVKNGDEVRVTVEGSEEFHSQFVSENKDLEGRIRIIPKISKKLDGKVSIEETDGDIGKAMHKYVMEVADMDDRIRERVWQKISRLM